MDIGNSGRRQDEFEKGRVGRSAVSGGELFLQRDVYLPCQKDIMIFQEGEE